MAPTQLSSTEFGDLLRIGELHRRVAEEAAPLVAAQGDGLDHRLDQGAMDQLGSLPAVILGVLSDPSGRPPEWTDLVVAPGSEEFAAALDTVESNPLAAVTMAALLRHAEHRSISEGLVAESTAYGLLQSGPEFAEWHRSADWSTRRAPQDPGAKGESPVLVTRQGNALSIVLNRPHVLNALDAGMRDGLDDALQIAISDASVTSVHLAGNGPSFCNGGDLGEFGSRSDPVTAHMIRLQRSIGRSLAVLAERTSVQIHGRTSGSGIELAAFAGGWSPIPLRESPFPR